mmetsp:Transcript_37788/g.96728  ORF Transcript_37788/g.96728 Transcript_37788/m.96728 type:complete len:334 (-) Transcript_37788:54-1055(-)
MAGEVEHQPRQLPGRLGVGPDRHGAVAQSGKDVAPRAVHAGDGGANWDAVEHAPAARVPHHDVAVHGRAHHAVLRQQLAVRDGRDVPLQLDAVVCGPRQHLAAAAGLPPLLHQLISRLPHAQVTGLGAGHQAVPVIINRCHLVVQPDILSDAARRGGGDIGGIVRVEVALRGPSAEAIHDVALPGVRAAGHGLPMQPQPAHPHVQQRHGVMRAAAQAPVGGALRGLRLPQPLDPAAEHTEVEAVARGILGVAALPARGGPVAAKASVADDCPAAPLPRSGWLVDEASCSARTPSAHPENASRRARRIAFPAGQACAAEGSAVAADVRCHRSPG